MKHAQRQVLLAFAIAMAAVGSVAPARDPLSELLGSAGFVGTVGGQDVGGPISIRDSIVGDIISISVNVTSTVRTNVSAELLQLLVCALNEYGDYGIEMADVRAALARYVKRAGSNGHR